MKGITLEKAIEKILFEDMSFGLHSRVSTIHDRPITSGEPDHEFKPNMGSTMQQSLPLRPTELMATQLADERPPIEDLDYSPVSVPALKAAVAALADLVPPDQVTRFYRRAQELLDDVTERQAESEIVKSAEVEEEIELSKDKEEENAMSKTTKNENTTSRRNRLSKLIKFLSEATNPYDVAVAGSGGDEFEAEIEKSGLQDAVNPDEKSLEEIADDLGYKSGASGAAQYIQNLLSKIRWLLETVGIDTLESLVENAYNEYIEALEADVRDMGDAAFLDAEDLDFMKSPQNKNTILTSGGFRYFLSHAFLGPAWSETKKAANGIVRDQLERSGIPPKLHQMVMNIIEGSIKGDVEKLKLRRISDYVESQSPGMSTKEIVDMKTDLMEKIREFISSVKQELNDDFFMNSIIKYRDLNDAKKNEILAQSFAVMASEEKAPTA